MVNKSTRNGVDVDHQSNVALQALPPALRLAVADVAIARVYEDGDIIIEQGDEAEGLYGLSAGVGAVWRVQPNGRKALLGFRTAGTWFGESALLADQPSAERLVARGQAQITFVPRAKFKLLIAQEPALLAACADWLCDKLKAANLALAESCTDTLQQRLAATLIELCHVLPNAIDHSRSEDTSSFAMTQEDLALHLGATRQRINQIMRQWEKNHWVNTDYRRITLKKPEALKKLAEDLAR